MRYDRSLNDQVWTSDRRAIARKTFLEWQGTPHPNRMAKRRVGIDCLGFMAQVLTQTGMTPPYRMPYYDERWGIGLDNNLMEWVGLTTLHCDRLEPDETTAFGDILIFAVGRQANHVGVVMDGRCCHSWAFKRSGVSEIELKDLEERIQCILRLNGPGFRRRPETLTQAELKAEMIKHHVRQ